MLRSYDIETAMNAIGYSHGRHEDQAQRVRDFRKVVKGTNFMTPRIVGMYRLKAKPQVIVELSLGEFLGDVIGVTVADCALQENMYDLSRAVHSTDELQAAIRELEGEYSK